MRHPDYPNVTSFTDRHGKMRWRYRKDGKQVSILGEPGTPEFDSRYQVALEGEPIADPKRIYRANPQGIRGNFPRRIERMLRQIRVRSVGLQREFDLTEEWLIAELERCDYRCSVTGIPFKTDREEGTRANPYGPSIDRIDCSRGYTLDNVRLVLLAVNIALSDFGLDLFDEICRARVMKLLSER